jgi:hypothetical protein
MDGCSPPGLAGQSSFHQAWIQPQSLTLQREGARLDHYLGSFGRDS